MGEKYRLLTRSDFDGLVCAILLKELDILADIKFVHPKDMQDGIIEVSQQDILTNLPYVEGCHLCFDHHSSEEIRSEGKQRENHVLRADADSAARVVYDYFGGRQRFPEIGEEMLEAVAKADSARFTKEEVLDPQGWVLLSFLMDARTGLGRFHDFRVSNYQLMMNLIDYCRDHTIDEILALPDVEERTVFYPITIRSPRIRSSAAAPCTTTWSFWTCAGKKQFSPRTASSFMRYSPTATSRFMCFGASRNKTSCLRSASRFSIDPVRRTWANCAIDTRAVAMPQPAPARWIMSRQKKCCKS